jgi:hypothetical protein
VVFHNSAKCNPGIAEKQIMQGIAKWEIKLQNPALFPEQGSYVK